MSFIKPKINPINKRKQQSFIPAPVNVTLIPPNITSSPTNAFGLIPPIYEPTITPGSAQISPA